MCVVIGSTAIQCLKDIHYNYYNLQNWHYCRDLAENCCLGVS